MKVLIVDDTHAVRHLIQSIVSSQGHEVTACADAETAWEAYQREFYPLVLLDWMLPGMDGLEFCRKVRTHVQGDRSVVVVITGRDQPIDLQTVLEAGADDYITKPVASGLLKVRLAIAEQRVRDVTQRKRAEQSLQQSHSDLLAMLDELQVGTAITDDQGGDTFLNRAARDLRGEDRLERLGGQHWTQFFSLPHQSESEIQAMLEQPPLQRSRIPAYVEGVNGQRYWMNIDVRDDPRDARRKLFFFHDMSEVYDLRRRLDEKAQFQDLVGKSKGMQEVYQQIGQVAKVDFTVLIEGETGTGKELVARAIHGTSARADQPFIAVNCAALTESLIGSQLFGHKRGAFTGAVEDHEGVLQAADGGTLLLDEIGDLPLDIQASLLRVLQEKEITRLGETQPRQVDVRVLAATHRNLEEEVARERFRQDLLYRIRIARIQLPPLRQRREDVPLLVGAMLRKHSAALGKSGQEISPECMRVLMDHPWPGNVRELENAIEFSMVHCIQSVIQPEDLPPEVLSPAAGGPDEREPRNEKEELLDALHQANGNRSVAAQLLGMSRSTFYRRLTRLGIDSKP